MSKNDRAEFRITALPNDTSDDRAVEKSRATPNSTQRLPLLVVEDDPDTQAFMKALLGRITT
jgi:hypothetical protein